MEAAQGAYRILAKPLPDRDEKIIASAREGLQVINGEGGSLSKRIEFYGNNFFRQLLDLPMFAGMLAGGVAYRVFRGLSTMMLFPRGVYLGGVVRTAGLMARSMSALMAETAVFTATKKRVGEAMGQGGSWRPEALRGEYLGILSLLGSVRLLGWGFGNLGNHINDSTATGLIMAKGLPLWGSYLGVLASPYVDYALKNRPSSPQKPDYWGALGVMVQFKAAGWLVGSSAPKRWAAFEDRMREQVTETKIPQLPPKQFKALIAELKRERLRVEHQLIREKFQLPQLPSVNPDPLFDQVMRNYSYDVVSRKGERFPQGGKLVFARAMETEGGSLLPMAREFQYTIEKVSPNGAFVLRHSGGKTIEVEAAAENPDRPFFSLGDQVVLLPDSKS